MSVLETEAIVACNFTVCRFCLQSEVDDLNSIYEKLIGTSDIVGVETTVRSTLTLLQIQISQNDGYPNYICNDCRSLLSSIQHFKNTVIRSQDVLDRAKVLKQFPDVQFRTPVQQEEYSIEQILKNEPSDSTNCRVSIGEEAIEVDNSEGLIDEKLEQPIVQEDYIVDDADNPDQTVFLSVTNGYLKEEIVEQIAEEIDTTDNNYTETEWVHDEHEEHTAAEEETETVYLDEEIEQRSEITVTEMVAQEQGAEWSEELDDYTEQALERIANKQCPVCGITSTAMAVHMRMHTNTRPFKCEICRKGFYTNSKLQTHMDSVHEGKRTYRCNVCQKAFAMKKTLNAHLMTHLTDSEKSFGCSQCPKSFLFRWALAKHERTHTGEKPFVCTLDGCGKLFASSSNLRQHQKTNVHWKLPRSDACQECGKVFQSKFHLRNHQKTHANKEASSKS